MLDTRYGIRDTSEHGWCILNAGMSNTYFQFKQFTIHQDRTAMKVTTDACLFGAWAGERVGSRVLGVGSRESGDRRPVRVLDIGTGTGLLALMLAQKIEDSAIDAVELDPEAYQQAKENVEKTVWAIRVHIFKGDARSLIQNEKYDGIISNPPFYEKELKGDNKKKNIAHHNEGLLVPQLLQIIRDHIQPHGLFYLLMPYKRNEEIRELLSGRELSITELVLVRQSVKHDYFRIMIEGSLAMNKETETNLTEIAIKDESDNYTPAFVDLLKDYYLKL